MEQVVFFMAGGSTSFCTVRPSAIDSVEFKKTDAGDRVFLTANGVRYEVGPIPTFEEQETPGQTYERLVNAMLNSDAPASPADDAPHDRLELVSVERRPEEAQLLQDCALAARLMTEAIGYLETADYRNRTDSAGVNVLRDYLREFIRSYEHVIDLRRG